VTAVVALAVPGAATATTFTVTKTGDAGPGTLRQAILDANANPGADEIVFAVTYHLITISGNRALAASGQGGGLFFSPGACYGVNILDNGNPFIVVDGDPERDGITTDVTLRFEGCCPATITTNSSGSGNAGNPPGEGFAIENAGSVYVTGTGPGTYTLAVSWSGISCPVPVSLQSFEIE